MRQRSVQRRAMLGPVHQRSQAMLRQRGANLRFADMEQRRSLHVAGVCLGHLCGSVYAWGDPVRRQQRAHVQRKRRVGHLQRLSLCMPRRRLHGSLHSRRHAVHRQCGADVRRHRHVVGGTGMFQRCVRERRVRGRLRSGHSPMLGQRRAHVRRERDVGRRKRVPLHLCDGGLHG